MDDQDRRNRILQFNIEQNALAENGYKRVLLQLFGYAGHGKSSFINSIIYTLGDEQYQMKAIAGDSDGGLTTERLAYQLNECITIVDNRGYDPTMDNQTGEIYAQLGKS